MKIKFLIAGCFLVLFSCTKDKEIVPYKLPSFEKTVGTNGTDILVDATVNTSESVMCVGYTNGVGAGGNDGWLVNVSNTGEILWQQTFGGSGDDYFNSILKTADGGFLITGFTQSNSAGAEDVWLLKLSVSGLVEWEKRYGGITTDLGINSIQLSDGTYIVSASTNSSGAGLLDHWLIKLDAAGTIISSKTFGNNVNQGYAHIMQKPDGNFFISGGTDKNGNSDFDVIEINSNLDSLHEYIFGSPDYEEAKNIVVLPDGNFILGGHSAGFGNPEHN
ncbi:MAG: hypothetical protein IAF38_11930, partial [Bacteroidia bacterium]|nr:hypothetical protein [Bacteroidia bacterium]